LSIFRDRTTTDERAETPTAVTDTPAEAAEIEAREAERVEAEERRLTVAEPVSPIAAARERFGGVDFPASLVGMLTALATVLLLGGIVGAAIGVIGYQTGLSGDNVEDITLASLIGGLAVLFVSYLVGGWTAGRIARYDGARNGLMTAVWTIVLAAALSALAAFFGSDYDVLANVDLPQWFDRDAVTTAAIASGVVAIATMLIGGLLGGLWGTRYHRLADETLLDAHDAAPRYP
jgi:ABC-type transport system involved in cytochrome c biogenesis permease subunit